MNKLKKWLAETNGWQRLWLVISFLFIIYSSVIWPVNTAGPMYYGSYYDLQKEEKNPKCINFINKPMGQLSRPNFGEDCYDIYSERSVYGDSIDGEFTAEKYLAHLREIRSRHIMEGRLIGLVGSLLLAGIAYGLGLILAWIIQGFKK